MSIPIWMPWVMLGAWVALDIMWCSRGRKSGKDVFTTGIDIGAFVVTLTIATVVSEWLK